MQLQSTLRIFTLLLLSLCLSFLAFSFSPTQLSFYTNLREWAPTVHTTTNSFHMWRADPLTGLLTSIIRGETVRLGVSLVPVQIALFFLGTALLYSSMRTPLYRNNVMDFVVQLLAVVGVLIALGADEVVFGSLQWIPWLTVLFGAVRNVHCISGAHLPLLICVAFVSLLNSTAANQLSLLSTLLALALSNGLTQGNKHVAPPNPSCVSRSLGVITLSIPFIFAISSTLTAPIAPFPSYPSSALIAPDDGIAGIIRPSFGLDFLLVATDRIAQRAILAPFGIFLGALVTLSFTLRLRAKRSLLPLHWCGLLLSACVLGDSAMQEQVTVGLPLQGIARVIPGASLLPLSLVVLGATIWLVVSMLPTILISTLALVGIVGIKAGLSSSSLTLLASPPESTPQSHTLAKLAFELPEVSLKQLVSPSLYVIRHFSYLFIKDTQLDFPFARAASSLTPRAISHEIARIETIPPSSGDSAAAVVDKNPATRWSPGGGKQTGGEALSIYFNHAQKFSGIRIESGAFPTDFPRGLTVSIPEECASPDSVSGTWSFPVWYGSLKFSPDEFPYFGPPGEVTIPFGAQVSSTCIRIIQTGRESHYDWSVAEILLLGP